MSTNDKADTGQGNGAPEGAAKDDRQVGSSVTPQAFSVDDVMWRVRAEVTRRRNGHVSSVNFPLVPSEVRSFDLSMPRWKPAVPRLQIKSNYHLSEFLAFSDADFIDTAFRAILRRPPDENAFNYYLQAVRGGGAAKVLVLRDFLATAEGKSSGVRIDGMFFPLLLEKFSRRKHVGQIVIWAHALLRLGTLADRQASYDAKESREIQELGRLVNEASEHLLQRIVALKVQMAGRVGTSEFETLKNEQASAKSRLARLETDMDREFAERPDGSAFAEMKQLGATAMNQWTDFEAEVRARFQAYEEQITHLKCRLESTTAYMRQFVALDAQASKEFLALDPFYTAFKEHLRGDRHLFRTRVEPNLALIREAGGGTHEAPIVDVGCGSGEWLEVIRECGLVGRGIEVNQVFVDICRGRGLEVTEGDAIESLRTMPDDSAGVVTLMHMLEELPFERSIALLDEARRVLRPGGLLLLETPNPENRSVGVHWSRSESARRNLLPPEALRWIVEERGFHNVRIESMAYAGEPSDPTSLPKDAPGAAAVNSLVASLSAPLDYAIVATRP